MRRISTSPRRRRLGQHFLRDRRAVARILAAFDPRPQDAVVEIGPGDGVLTLPLAGRVGRLLAVEVDGGLAAALRRRLPPRAGIEVITGDILTLDAAALAARLTCPPPARCRVLGNLPYRIATVVLGRLLPRAEHLRDLLVMVQREVADRLLAGPGGAAYGALSIFVQLHAVPTRVLDLPPAAFVPPPQVHSTVVGLELLPAGDPDGQAARAAAVRLAAAAFTHRRKMLANALAAAGLPPAPVARALAACALEGRARPQELAPADWLRLAARLPAPGRS